MPNPTKTSTPGTTKPTCYKCRQIGHLASECTAKPAPSVAPTAATAPPPPPHAKMAVLNKQPCKSKTIQSSHPYEVPVSLDGASHLALIDTGASISMISQALAATLQLTLTPTEGVIGTIDPSHFISRVGRTAPVRLQCGPLTTLYSFEVLPAIDGPQIILGRDIIAKIGLDSFGLPFTYPNHNNQDVVSPPEDDTPPIAEPTWSKEEGSEEFVTYRQELLDHINPLILENQEIPTNQFCPIPEATIHLPTNPDKYVFRRQYPIAKHLQSAVTAEVERWLEQGIIEQAPVFSTFNTPIFAVPKKDDQGKPTLYRICLDYRSLNELLPNDNYPLPRITDIFQALSGSAIFSTLDLKSAYHRFPIATEDRHKTAFTWNNTQYVFRGAPFGLKTLPSQFQRVMQSIFQGLDFVLVYFDDIIVFSKNRADHAKHIQCVIQRLNQARLILSPGKCHFGRLELKLLGFIVNPYGHSIDPERLVNIADWPVPTKGKQLQHYLGFFNYFREHIPLASTLTAPLDAIRMKDDLSTVWNDNCQQAFDNMKMILPSCLPLAYPDSKLPFCIATDASNVGIGAVLYQVDPTTKNTRWISFQARSLTKAERNYSATKKELLAVTFALKRFHHYIWGTRFTLYTDHAALVYLHTQKELNPMLINWYETIFIYNFSVIHRPGIANILPDHLSRIFPTSAAKEEDIAAVSPPVVKMASASSAQPTSTPPEDQREEILQHHHLLGHFGANAMVNSIHAAGYNWPNLKQEALRICKNCIACLRFNIAKKGYHPLKPIHAAQPFDHIAIDLAGPLPTSAAGNHYLFVLIDIHSRFVILNAIPNKQMATIARHLLQTFSLFGFPKIIQSDNGTEFVNHIMAQLCTQAGIDHRLITPYHPRANGIAERTVQTAIRLIKKLLNGVKKEWDLHVPFAQFCINQKIAEIHQSAPFSVMFGRTTNAFNNFSNIDSNLPDSPDAEQQAIFLAEVNQHIREMKEALFPGIADKISNAQAKGKAYFDANHRQVSFPLNSYVMVRDTRRSNKLDPINEGPYKIINKTKGGAYILEDGEGKLLERNFPPSALIIISADPIYGEPSYEVEAILNHRKTDNGYEYLVRWKNYTADDDSWEPQENFDDLETIQRYWVRRNKAKPPFPSA